MKPTFNKAVFEPRIQHIASEVATAVQSPEEFVYASLLASVSAVVGKRLKFEVKPGYYESACIWQVAIGRPSTGKSPSLRYFMQYLDEKDEKAHETHEQAQKTAADTAAEKGEAYRETDFYAKVVTNTTIEGLAVAMKENKDGVLFYADEFQSFVKGFDKYSKAGGGSEEGQWNSIYSHQNTNINRKTSKNIYIKNPYVALLGGTQPKPWKELRGMDSGFIFRFLIYDAIDYCITDYTMQGISQASNDYSRQLLGLIDSRYAEGTTEVVKMDLEAQAYFLHIMQSLTVQIRGYQKEGEDEKDSAVGKFRQHFCRLALVLHALELKDELMGADTLRKAWELINGYFLPVALANIDEVLGEAKQLHKLNPQQKKAITDLIPKESFTKGDFLEQCEGAEMLKPTAEKFLRRLIKLDLCEKVRHGVYKLKNID